MSQYIAYADCYVCHGSGWVGEGPGGCQGQCADCATRRAHETSRHREQKLRDRIAELEKALHEFLRVCESAVPIKFLDELGVAADMARKAMSSRL